MILLYTYNHLNLPRLFTLGSNTIEIEYDGGGNKLRKTVKQGSTTLYIQNYLGGIEYNSARLEAVFHAEGRVYNTNVGTGSSTLVFRYEYAIRDHTSASLGNHLGNTRILFTDKNDNGVLNVTAGTDNEIIQENQYYPFGMNQEGTFMNDAAAKDTKYQYNSKELNDDFGLNWSDYGARWYDAAIGRWGQLDPISEKYLSLCPYIYVSNNPINAIDPDGNRIIFVNGYLGFGSPEGGPTYWNGANSDFVRGAKNYLGDDDTFFSNIKHNSLSTANNRIKAGEKWAMDNYKELIRGLDKDKDDFKFVTHSMGTAFAEGVMRHLKFMGWNVTQAIHFEPFQAEGFTTNTDPPGYGTPFNTAIATTVVDYQLTNDPVLNYAPTNNSGKLEGAFVSIREKGQSELEYRHREPIDSGRIWGELSRLISEALNREGTTIINSKK